MRPIQMVDTQTQYQKIKREIDLAIQQVLDSSAYINGKIVQEFSLNLAKYLDVKQVIPCANGTDALQIAMMALDLQPGDEVITPSFTYFATVEVIGLPAIEIYQTTRIGRRHGLAQVSIAIPITLSGSS